MKKAVAISMVALILVLAPLTLGAQEAKEHGKMKMEGGQFGLDEKTHAIIADLMVEYRMKNIDLGAEMKKLRLQIRQEWMSEKPSQDKLNKLAQQMGDVRIKMQKGRIDFLFEAKKNLTDEQWKKFLRHHQRRGGRKGRDGRMHMRHGRARSGCSCGHSCSSGKSGCRSSCRHGGSIKASGGGHLHGHGELMLDDDDNDEDLHLE